MQETGFIGREGLVVFYGVVEDRIDPDQLGRVKVRILGNHSKDKSYIATEDLQWAMVVQPITSSGVDGIGSTPLGLLPGSWCFGFFRDGHDMQEPVILGSLGGIPQSSGIPTDGFSDPRNSSNGTTETLETAPRKIATRTYPTDGSGAQLTNGTTGVQYPDILNEPDTNRIARNQNIDQTILQVIANILDVSVPIAFGGTWNEPQLWYNGQYPFVQVHESESGHVKVVDDTPNAEGQLDVDRTGSFVETLTDGSKVHKIVKDGYTIVLKDNHVHIMGNETTRVDHECNLSVGQRLNVEVTGNINILTHGNTYIQSLGDTNITANGELNATCGGDANISISGATKISSVGKLSIRSNSGIDITAAGNFNVEATQIYFNSQRAQPDTPSTAVTPKQ